MIMPNGTTGSELATELSTRQPSLKIVLTTGYSPDLLNQGALAGARVLLKPFSCAQLLALLREALDVPVAAQR
jgi:CheY-like chemotaxis protein